MNSVSSMPRRRGRRRPSFHTFSQPSGKTAVNPAAGPRVAKPVNAAMSLPVIPSP